MRTAGNTAGAATPLDIIKISASHAPSSRPAVVRHRIRCFLPVHGAAHSTCPRDCRTLLCADGLSQPAVARRAATERAGGTCLAHQVDDSLSRFCRIKAKAD